jgi:alginate O-acetyltransferase complex protein AlgI
MAIIADTILDSFSSYGTILLWMGAIAYTLQIYYDFSGYSDMAIGLGQVCGFNFLENFNYPYIAKSITDFWRRWHISLSSWFRDYVYIPLGGSRVSVIRNILNILIVWMLTGFWHGASWNFILWGLYFAILLILEKFAFKNIINKFPNIFRYIITLFLVIISWVIFRNTNILDLGIILKNMFIYKYSDIIDFIFKNTNLIFSFYFVVPAIVFCIPLKKIIKIGKNISNNLFVKLFVDFIYIFLFIINISFLASNTYNPFIYFRF